MTRDSVRAALPAVALTVSAALSGWYVMTTAGPQWQVLTCWFVVALFATMMSYFSVRASREMKRADPRRRFWTALGTASAIWAAGEWAQLAGAVRSPSSLAALTGTGVVRTTALVLGCVVVTVVVLTYPIPHRSPHERLCYLLDLATVVTAAGTYGLYWTVSTVRDGSGMANGLVAVAAGPVIAMLTAFAVCRLFLSGVAPFRWPIGVMGPFAAGVEALARALGPELVRAGRPGMIFALTVCSHALLMIAARSQFRSAGTDSDARRATRKRPFSLLPYAALGGTFALLVVTLAVGGLDVRAWVAVAGVAAITAVVVARQLTAFVDNAELLRQRDILTARLHTMAFSDSLTGLGNRALFLEHLEKVAGEGTEVGVMLIDLDDFKPVNDAYGHAAGDAVLVETAARLRAGVGPGDVVARLGGDEFAVLTRRPHLEDITAVADEIARAVAEPCQLPGGEQVRVRASIGVATGPGLDAPMLLRRADEAMYEAKCSGKGSVRFAQPA